MTAPDKSNRPGRRVPRSRDELVASCAVPMAVLLSHILAWFTVLSHDPLLHCSRTMAVFLAFYWGLGVLVLWGLATTAFCTSYAPTDYVPENVVAPLPVPEGDSLVKRDKVRKACESFDSARWCYSCQAYKPPRCHHCTQCGRCVLRCDHHCICLCFFFIPLPSSLGLRHLYGCAGVGGCVSYRNHKAFVQLVVYGLIEILLTFGVYVRGIWVGVSSNPIPALKVAGELLLAVSCFCAFFALCLFTSFHFDGFVSLFRIHSAIDCEKHSNCCQKRNSVGVHNQPAHESGSTILLQSL